MRNHLALWYMPRLLAADCVSLMNQVPDLSLLMDDPQGVGSSLGLSKEAVQYLKEPNWTAVDRDCQWVAASERHHIVCYSDHHYPALLKAIDHPPPVLFVKGNLDILSSPQIAMVGSRHPSVSGLALAKQFSEALVEAGLCITSGLATGIDGASHQAAIKAGGKTVAVFGTGVDRIYPVRHRRLAAEIVESEGALVSEFPLGTAPLPRHFPQRNRIVSGLSYGVLVVEAAINSGSLHTARWALEQGREVFTIPGSIHNPVARGCHQLLRDGAKLVECVEDILEELPIQVKASTTSSRKLPVTTRDRSTLSADQRRFLHYMGDDMVTIDALVERSGLTSAQVSSILLNLEIDGLIQSAPGGFCRLQ